MSIASLTSHAFGWTDNSVMAMFAAMTVVKYRSIMSARNHTPALFHGPESMHDDDGYGGGGDDDISFFSSLLVRF